MRTLHGVYTLVPRGCYRKEDTLSRIQQVIEALEAERTDVQQRLQWLDKQIQEFRDHHRRGGTAAARPARSSRRASSRRATTPRATGGRRRGETKGKIIAFLKEHPGSTAGDVASGLKMNRNTVATRLTQLSKSGDIKKAAKGYSA
jgi:hypothetical protein